MEAAKRETWLNAAEVSDLFVNAGLFPVPRSTLRAWSDAGKISAVRTLGGHRRYRESECRSLAARLCGGSALAAVIS